MTNINKFSVQVVNANEESIVETLSQNLKKGAAVNVTTFKETTMNKGTKTNRNPFLGRVTEQTTLGGWQVGTNYSNSCQKAANRSGSDEEFEAKQSWHIYYNDFFETDKNTNMKFYLQLQKSAKSGCKTEKTYFIDGKPATEEEVNLIKEWLPKSKKNQSSSQVNAGIDEEHEREYILIALSNIQSIKQGEFNYNICKSETKAVALAYAK